jgi:hypothetical protein
MASAAESVLHCSQEDEMVLECSITREVGAKSIL